MGQEEPDPDDCLRGSTWVFAGLNCTGSMKLVEAEVRNKHQTALPAYLDTPDGVLSGNACVPFEAIEADKLPRYAPAMIHHLVPGYGAKRFLVFDQSRDETKFMFWSSNVPVPCPRLNSYSLGMQRYRDELDSSGGDKGEEMRENTEEIDALLYSDSSDEDHDEEEASTGHSPVKPVACITSESASSVLPAKRRRGSEDETDTSVTDTASSGILRNTHVKDAAAESSCMKGGAPQDPSGHNKQLKRAKIQETMTMLRKIIPGGKGKDTATILEDAIRILNSMQKKANFAASPL